MYVAMTYPEVSAKRNIISSIHLSREICMRNDWEIHWTRFWLKYSASRHIHVRPNHDHQKNTVPQIHGMKYTKHCQENTMSWTSPALPKINQSVGSILKNLSFKWNIHNAGNATVCKTKWSDALSLNILTWH